MALYAIGDLHLCLGAPKPMDVFGGNWVGYMEKLAQGLSVIGENDTHYVHSGFPPYSISPGSSAVLASTTAPLEVTLIFFFLSLGP